MRSDDMHIPGLGQVTRLKDKSMSDVMLPCNERAETKLKNISFVHYLGLTAMKLINVKLIVHPKMKVLKSHVFTNLSVKLLKYTKHYKSSPCDFSTI